MQIKINKLNKAAVLPSRANESDAGYDLYATRDMIIAPMQRAIVPTGISIEVPNGYYARVAPRSGLAVKSGIDVLAGVIDSGYNGEIGVVLINTDKFEAVNLPKSSRIAQLIFEKCEDMNFETVLSLDVSERNIGGFGSSGE